MNWKLVLNFSLSAGGGSPSRIARTVVAYSRISRTGLSIVWPYQFSTVTRCDTPRPRITRPPAISSTVAAIWAVATGDVGDVRRLVAEPFRLGGALHGGLERSPD